MKKSLGMLLMLVACIEYQQPAVPIQNPNLAEPILSTPTPSGGLPEKSSPITDVKPPVSTGQDLLISAFKTTKESTDKFMIEFKTNNKAQCRFSKSETTFNSMNSLNITGGVDHAHLFWGLAVNTKYQFFIKCRDEDGIEKSTQTSFSTATWLLPELKTTIDSNSSMGPYLMVDFKTERQAECRIASSVMEFEKMRRFNSTNDTSHAVLVWGLESGEQYTYNVLCRDLDGVESNNPKIQFTAK